jgi:hypothetical protein
MEIFDIFRRPLHYSDKFFACVAKRRVKRALWQLEFIQLAAVKSFCIFPQSGVAPADYIGNDFRHSDGNRYGLG